VNSGGCRSTAAECRCERAPVVPWALTTTCESLGTEASALNVSVSVAEPPEAIAALSNEAFRPAGVVTESTSGCAEPATVAVRTVTARVWPGCSSTTLGSSATL